MLNEIHLEGAITHTWTWSAVQFARVACRVEPGRQQVSEGDGRPSQYVTLRFEPPTLSRAASTLTAGQVVRATGWLSSREYGITLSSFARSAEGDRDALADLRKLADRLGNRAQKPHVLNEVVVERFSVVEDGRSRKRREADQKPEQRHQSPRKEDEAPPSPAFDGKEEAESEAAD